MDIKIFSVNKNLFSSKVFAPAIIFLLEKKVIFKAQGGDT